MQEKKHFRSAKHHAKAFNFMDRHIQNIGTFNNGYMDEDSKKVFQSYTAINAIDTNVYPELIDIKKYCGEFILKLFHADNFEDFRYFTTSGSSESIFLSLISLKERWKQYRVNHKGLPNIILGKNPHVSWKNSAHHLGVQVKEVPLIQNTLSMSVSDVIQSIDENTMAVICSLGSPVSMVFDQVALLNVLLQSYFSDTRHFVPIHVDAASGGFIAPFHSPEFAWDFALDHVVSINVSSHKYGMVYPSLGWLLTRTEVYLEKNLAHKHYYLGEEITQFSIRFSHSESQLMAQHYLFKSLGVSGCRSAVDALFSLYDMLIIGLATIPRIILIPSTKQGRLPGIILSIKDNDLYLSILVEQMRELGWIIPTFDLQSFGISMKVSRIVLRYGMTKITVERLVSDIRKCFKVLSNNGVRSCPLPLS